MQFAALNWQQIILVFLAARCLLPAEPVCTMCYADCGFVEFSLCTNGTNVLK